MEAFHRSSLTVLVVQAILLAALALASVLSAVVVPILAFIANLRHVVRREDRHVSTTPVVGSVLGFLAVICLPIGPVRDRLAWSWAPLGVELVIIGLTHVCWRVCGDGRRRAMRGSPGGPPRR